MKVISDSLGTEFVSDNEHEDNLLRWMMEALQESKQLNNEEMSRWRLDYKGRGTESREVLTNRVWNNSKRDF